VADPHGGLRGLPWTLWNLFTPAPLQFPAIKFVHTFLDGNPTMLNSNLAPIRSLWLVLLVILMNSFVIPSTALVHSYDWVFADV